MKFIHLSDAHLDSPFLGLSFLPFNQLNAIKNSSNESFHKAVTIAIEEEVDLFLIAGDTFDSVTPSPKSQLFLLQELERLINNKIQIVMILGNHDYLSPQKMLLPQNPYFKLLGANQEVETFKGNTQTGFSYQVHGFSYQKNHIHKDMVENFPVKDPNSFNIGLMHAQEERNQVGADVYAPFKLSDLKNLAYDYFALGHIHKRQNLSQQPLIAYSGNIQGRHINERGPKGISLVTVDEQTNQASIEFIKTSKLEWKLLEIKIPHPLKPQELFELIEMNINQNISSQNLVGIKLKGSEFLTEEQEELLREGDALKEISQKLKFNSALVKVYFQVSESIQLNPADKDAFQEAQKEILTKEKLAELSKSLVTKGDWINEMVNKQDFLDEVTELAQVKLGQKLKDKINETD
ncbi:metallophosphoesterase family protein [Lactobacillus sp. PV012]|uniref:metallophosphoesterase family protein n=1 Tax=Lactobacillus sp. PV012 TaxID=2594494 RepID=UPI0022407002|nr:DNA repair exonuclease [Lactobacillus sp. PV012]QNQ81955.1 DNA repair exonuclease [Lactobacillus sp. PV012]